MALSKIFTKIAIFSLGTFTSLFVIFLLLKLLGVGIPWFLVIGILFVPYVIGALVVAFSLISIYLKQLYIRIKKKNKECLKMYL